jgi:pyridinium-3,5-biscarboxylic acid mononucleotide synthase
VTTRARVLSLLQRVADGSVTVDDALRELSLAPYETLDFATVDHHRALRQGFPEVIFGAGKTPAQIVAIAERVAVRGSGFLVTRADGETREALARRYSDARVSEIGRTVTLEGEEPPAPGDGTVVIVTAGTSDEAVAEEASTCACAFGDTVERVRDVGVAGLHRLLAHGTTLSRARVIIVIAGMDGALPSVVGGLVACPVIAVPTSVGYGASLGGLTALFTMLNSCAAGVTVVNIDNGFGAAMAAARITHRLSSAAGERASPGRERP